MTAFLFQVHCLFNCLFSVRQNVTFSTLYHTWPVINKELETGMLETFGIHSLCQRECLCFIHMHPCWLTQPMQVAVRTDWEPALGHSSPCSGVPVYSTNSRTQGPVSDYLSFHSKHALETAPLILNNHLVWNHLIRLSVPAIYSCFLLYIYTTFSLVSCIMLHLYIPQITLTFAKIIWITVIKPTIT